MAKKILIIEDEKEVAQIMRKKIQSAGYEAYVAFNGQEGLAMAREIHPHLVLTDLAMPVMDGFMFFNEMRKGQDTSHIPVIIASAHGTNEEKMRALGAKDFVHKPFDMPTVLGRIGSYFYDQRAVKIMIATKMFFLMQAILDDAKEIAQKIKIHLTNDQSNLVKEASVLKPDLIMLDVDMFIEPHASEIVQALRKEEALKESQILLIRSLNVAQNSMGKEQQEDVEKCLQSGASHFIGNLNKESFLHVIQEYCS